MEIRFRFPLSGGLHARPAAVLRECAQRHACACEWVNERTGQRAPLGDLLALLATNTRQGDPCRLVSAESGAKALLDELGRLLEGEAFLATDAPELGQAGVISAPGALSGPLPGLLARSGARWWEGQGVSPGLGEAPLRILQGVGAPPSGGDVLELALPGGAGALRAARRRLEARLRRDAAAESHPVARGVLEAQAALLAEGGWIQAMDQALEAGLPPLEALKASTDEACARLEALENAALRERSQDLRDLEARLRAELGGAAPEGAPPELEDLTVLMADTLSPSQFLALRRPLLRGLILGEGGRCSHTAILARSFGIPCVSGLGALGASCSGLREGERVLVDGRRGLVVAEPPETLRAYYRLEEEGERQRAALAGAAAEGASGAVLADGSPLLLEANISAPEELAGALDKGARGVGLFRTEMLFLHRDVPPDEAEQCLSYTRVLQAAQGRPVVLRLLDAGGDKALPFLGLPLEANPFLGIRGVRCYPRQPGLVRTQLRAAMRAAVHGDLRLLVPMVAEVEELRWVRQLIRSVEAELSAEGASSRRQEWRGGLPLGAMVEVPAAALQAAALAQEADFLCVGSNDLVQYLFAADRGDAQVAKAEHDWHPATLRALAGVVEGARAAGRPLSLCGEMASRPSLLPLLVGLGFRELSVGPAALEAVRAALANLEPQACRDLVRRALKASTAPEVASLLRSRQGPARVRPFLDPDLVVLDASCATKEEAIKLLVERMVTAGRASDPLELESVLWAREAHCATAVGFGFAVPHCKSPAVGAASLGFLRLREGVDWGAPGQEPVRCVLVLAMDGTDGGQEHLRIFARLARRLMDPGFRASLLEASQPARIIEYLNAEVLAAP